MYNFPFRDQLHAKECRSGVGQAAAAWARSEARPKGQRAQGLQRAGQAMESWRARVSAGSAATRVECGPTAGRPGQCQLLPSNPSKQGSATCHAPIWSPGAASSQLKHVLQRIINILQQKALPPSKEELLAWLQRGKGSWVHFGP